MHIHFLTDIFSLILIYSCCSQSIKKTIPFETIKREVLDVLRFAPYLPGGLNYAKVNIIICL